MTVADVPAREQLHYVVEQLRRIQDGELEMTPELALSMQHSIGAFIAWLPRVEAAPHAESCWTFGHEDCCPTKDCTCWKSQPQRFQGAEQGNDLFDIGDANATVAWLRAWFPLRSVDGSQP